MNVFVTIPIFVSIVFKYRYMLCSQCTSSMLFVARRRGTNPPIFVLESSPLFEAIHMRPLDTVAYHYLPDSSRSTDLTGGEWRGLLERSHTFMACYVELYCRPHGICLELGCGTAPILKACLRTRRLCASLDQDERLITSYVQPLLLTSIQEIHGGPSTMRLDDDVDAHAGDNPYD